MTAAEPEYAEQVYYKKAEAFQKAFGQSIPNRETVLILSPDQINRIEKRLGWKISDKSVPVLFANAGVALVLNEPGKHFPITFMVAISKDRRVKEVIVMVYREKIGSEVRKTRFLKQFSHKSSDDRFEINGDIHGISGATISSWSLAGGVRKALIIAEETGILQ